MRNIAEKIILAQNGSEKAMLEIIEVFSPIINKYTRLLKYDEDCRSELILKLITLIKNEIDLKRMKNKNDGAIINYINSAIKHYYISISKAACKLRDNELLPEQDFWLYTSENNATDFSYIENYIITDTIKSVLTRREFYCVYSIILNGLTAEEVAKTLNISKQAVNQCKKRALQKLKKHFV